MNILSSSMNLGGPLLILYIELEVNTSWVIIQNIYVGKWQSTAVWFWAKLSERPLMIKYLYCEKLLFVPFLFFIIMC